MGRDPAADDARVGVRQVVLLRRRIVRQGRIGRRELPLWWVVQVGRGADLVVSGERALVIEWVVAGVVLARSTSLSYVFVTTPRGATPISCKSRLVEPLWTHRYSVVEYSILANGTLITS